MNIFFTSGRAGSTYLANLLLMNLGVEYLEWFSPESYQAAFNSGDASSKDEYLDYVYGVICGKDNRYGAKLTTDLCADQYWERNILDDVKFQEVIATNNVGVILTRLNPWDTFRSLLQAEISGNWHASSPEDETGQIISTRLDTNNIDYERKFAEFIDTEVKLFSFAIKNLNQINIFFYEEFFCNKIYFTEKIFSYFNSCETPFEELKIPDNQIVYKNLDIKLFVDSQIRVLSKSPYVCKLLKSRGERFREIGLFSMHHSLY